jgi:hypothetical protein
MYAMPRNPQLGRCVLIQQEPIVKAYASDNQSNENSNLRLGASGVLEVDPLRVGVGSSLHKSGDRL